MDIVIARHIASIVLGELQRFESMGVVPLFNSHQEGPEYLTFSQALAQNHLTVAEATDSVSKLNVMSRAEIPVLLLEGEELGGARQSGVLNRTILLQDQAETVIPVGCAEGNGWSHPSSARVKELERYLQAFQPVPRQRGFLATINGEIVGLDIVSREGAFQLLHPTLIKRYAMDAWFEEPQASHEQFYDQALNFFHEAAKCEERAYPSSGGGLNFEFDGPIVSGSALVVGQHVIHLSLFRTLAPPQRNDGFLTRPGYEGSSLCRRRAGFSSIAGDQDWPRRDMDRSRKYRALALSLSRADKATCWPPSSSKR